MRAKSFLAAPVVAREQSHRRTLIVASGALVVLGTSPVFGHHLAGSADAVLAGRDHLWALCLVALHLILAPVHHAFHLVLVVGFVYAVWDRVRAWQSVRRSLAALAARAVVPGDAFWRAAQAASLDARRLRVVDGLPSPVFTVGWLQPRVYAAGELADVLAPAELAAVIAHESAHVRRRDPLRLSVLRFLACTLFWIPALRRLADDLADEAEIQADDSAARRSPLALASAILRLAQGPWGLQRPDAPMRAAVGFRQPDLLSRRVRRLAGEDVRAGTHVTRRSLAGAAGALVVVWLSGAMMAHPLPAATVVDPQGDHCEHHHTLAVMHLFCLAGGTHASVRRATAPACPHGAG